jgi:hypothetical protein
MPVELTYQQPQRGLPLHPRPMYTNAARLFISVLWCMCCMMTMGSSMCTNTIYNNHSSRLWRRAGDPRSMTGAGHNGVASGTRYHNDRKHELKLSWANRESCREQNCTKSGSILTELGRVVQWYSISIHPSWDPNVNDLWQLAIHHVSSTTQLAGSCCSMNSRNKRMDN